MKLGLPAVCTTLVLALPLLGSPAVASSGYQEVWSTELTDDGAPRGLDTDGRGAIFLGALRGKRTVVQRYDGDGALAWSATTRRDLVRDVALAPDGNSVAAAGSNANSKRLWVTVLTSDDGSRVWRRRYNVKMRQIAEASVAFAPDGASLYVVGAGTDRRGNPGYFVVRLDATGKLVWRKVVPGALAHGLAVDPSGEAIFAIGETADGAYPRFLIVRYLADGAVDWSHDEDIDAPQQAFAGLMGPKRSIVTVGRTTRGGSVQNASLMRLTRSGGLVWSSFVPIDHPSAPTLFDVAASKNGRVLHAAGQTCPPDGSSCSGAFLTKNVDGSGFDGRVFSFSDESDTRFTEIARLDRDWVVMVETGDGKAYLARYLDT